jgi:hypothetical protein
MPVKNLLHKLSLREILKNKNTLVLYSNTKSKVIREKLSNNKKLSYNSAIRNAF